MKIIRSRTSLSELWQNRETQTTDLLKIVVDIKRNIIAVDAEMHADLEELLLENSSEQEDLWGANLFPERNDEKFIEYTSFINIRPAQENRSMEVQNETIKDKILKIVDELIER
jgi:hypothetical protein